MYSLRSQFRRIKIALFSLLILFFITAAPDRQWASAPAAAQCPAITLNPANLSNATLGASYSRIVTATGGTPGYTYTIFGGALPPGLSLTPSTGSISGTPTALGNFTFIVRARDSQFCFGARTYTIQVNCPTITLGPNLTQNGAIGQQYSLNLTANGGQSPYNFSRIAGAIPPGLFMSSAGTIGGTPTETGSFSFTVRATDANGCAGEKTYSITVICPTITISPATLPDGTVGRSYSRNLSASGSRNLSASGVQGAYEFGVLRGSGDLPPGLALSREGRITGFTTTVGSYSFTVMAQEPGTNCSGARAYTINVVCPEITFNPATLPGGSVGAAYSQNLSASGGQGPYNYSLFLGSLPLGLNLSSTGAITGTPAAAGSYSFTVRVRDANNCFSSQQYNITVTAPCPAIMVNPPQTLSGRVGVPYFWDFNATGGRSPYTFAISGGALPPGLTISSNTIAGTPATEGSYTFTLGATDANGCRGERQYTILIGCPIITINPTALPPGTVGAAYSQTFSATGGTAPYQFGTNASALPPGLTLNTNGTLSGTPTTAGNYTFIIRGDDAYGCFGEHSYTLVVNNQVCPTITVSPAEIPVAQVGLSYSQMLSATGGTAPYSFSIVSGALPSGVSLATNGNLSGTPGTQGYLVFRVRATDANGCTGERLYTLIVNNAACPTVTLNPNSLPAPLVGSVYNQMLSATGGTAPYVFSSMTGSLPPGLSLASNGNLTGAPTTAGSYNFIVRATDSNGCTGDRTYTLNVTACPIITLNPASLPVGQAGLAYSQTLSANGGTAPYSFTLNGGSLPPGMSLASNGALTGAPTAAGNYAFSVRVTDANGCAGGNEFSLRINNPVCPAIILNPAILPAPRVGVLYNQTFSATGGTAPYTFVRASGTLPPGLSLSSNGNLTGTPTTTGSYTFTVRVTDANGCVAERSYMENVLPCEGITISPTGTGVPSGRVGVAYSLTFTATGGAAPYAFSTNTPFLPPGLTLSSTGLLSGTPTTRGSYSFPVTATSANGCVESALIFVSISDAACPSISITPSTVPTGTTGVAYNQTFTASGGTGPYSFTIDSGALPPALSLSTNGDLTGTPTQAGLYTFSIRATDANGCAGVRAYQFLINNPSCPIIAVNPMNPTLPEGKTGVSYSQSFSATGTASYVFTISLGILPGGLSLNSNGNLTGMSTTSGNYSFIVRATDENGCYGERNYTLVVNNPVCPTITIIPTGLSNGAVGAAYNQMIAATGGSAPYSFSVIAGSLPAGLTLNAATGALTGTPTTAGNYSFTARATDSIGCPGERVFTLAIAVNAVTSVSAASFATGGSLAAESIVAGFGSNLAASTPIASTLPLPTELAGVSLKVRDSAGAERLAPLFFVSPAQINYLMPPGASVGPASVTVFNGADVVAAGAVEVATVSPGMFSADGSGQGLASAIALRVRANGIQSFEPVARYDAALSRFVAVPIDVSSTADQVFLVFYGTGWRFRSALSAASCSIGGVTSDVLYAGEVAGFVGYDQMNVRLSPSLAGRGEVDVIVTVDGVPANVVRIATQ